MQREQRTGEWIEGCLVRFLIPEGVTTYLKSTFACLLTSFGWKIHDHLKTNCPKLKANGTLSQYVLDQQPHQIGIGV